MPADLPLSDGAVTPPASSGKEPSPGAITKDDVKAGLEAIKQVHLALLAILGALFILSLSPLDAQHYGQTLRALYRVPELPLKSDLEWDQFWKRAGGRITDLNAIRARMAQAVDGQALMPVASKLLDPEGGLKNLWLLNPGANDIKRPESARLEDIVTFLDDIASTSDPVIDASALIDHLMRELPSSCAPCTLAGAHIKPIPGVKERVDVRLQMSDAKQRPVETVLKDVATRSDGAAAIEAVSRYVMKGILAPNYDSSDEAAWRSYVYGRQFHADLAPAWEEIRRLRRQDAVTDITAKMQKSRQTMSLFGISIDEDIAVVAGPLFLLGVAALLLAHVSNFRSLAQGAPEAVARYPWPPFFAGRLGLASSVCLTVVLPLAALAAFEVRSFRSALAEGSSATLEAMIGGGISVVAAGACLWLFLMLWGIQRTAGTATPPKEIAS